MAPAGGRGGREVLLHEAVVEYAEAERAQSAPSDERVMKAVKLLTAARQLPSRVAGLIWVDSMKRLGTPWTAEQVQAFLEPFRANFVDATRAFVRGMFVPSSDRSLVERVVADISSAPPAVELGAGEYALSYSREIPQVL